MLIELLYIEGCPGHETVWEWIREFMHENDGNIEFKRIHVRTPDQAEELKFLGSPTVRINGKDVIPSDDSNYGVQCRLYEGKRGMNYFPPRRVIEEAILKANQ